MLIASLLIAVGLLALVIGGESLVRGASSLAAALRISPLVIGLTVVAFGTSAPELAVSLQSVLTGESDLAVGNVVGSNITNVLLILGLSALISPLIVASQLIRLDVPLMIASSLIMLFMAMDGSLGRIDGIILFGILVIYTVWLIWQSRREPEEIQHEFEEGQFKAADKPTKMLAQIGFVVLGLLLLGFGSNWLVSGAVSIARMLGVEELVIGLTIVAIGTSMPEVVTSVMASIRGQRDIAVGNVVGSNIFNILCVIGLSATVAPDGIAVAASALKFDIPIMIVVAIACLPIFFTGNLVARWEGGLFFVYYLAYMTYLVLDATDAPISRTFGVIVAVFLVPLTVITILVGLVRTWRSGNQRSSP